ncbi:MAG: glycosyltransferase [Prevotella sp.]|nr:glycosyltransferase [Prevotella sp.]
MIFVHDKGRMANNILQYGHVYAWGREHARPTVSMRFAYKYPYFHICHTPRHNFPTYVFAKYAAKWHLMPTASFDEERADVSAQEQLMLRSRMVMVTGWYAHWYDLFLKYKAEILQLFAFDAAVEQAVAPLLSSSEGCLRLGVHIRRGDYKTFHGGRFFYDDAQYADIISRTLDMLGRDDVHIYICGNDPHLDRSCYEQRFGSHRVTFPDGNPGEDLCLLSHCDRLIGPPSTFSLVAAMYRDLPLYWVTDPQQPVTEASFGHFDQLFQHII